MRALGIIVGLGALAGAGAWQSDLIWPDFNGAFPPPVLPENVLPPRPRTGRAGPQAIRFSADRLGQFWIRGRANETSVRFLIDTGASDVAFSKRDAELVGIDVSALTFDRMSTTANGMVRTAAASLKQLAIGPFTVADVPVSVIDGGLEHPLLGMTFLRRMNVAISGGTLTLSGNLE